MRSYLLEGEQAAHDLPNRGPIRFDVEGRLHQDILDAYSRYGFYIFENVLDEAELNDLREDLDAMRASFPTPACG